MVRVARNVKVMRVHTAVRKPADRVQGADGARLPFVVASRRGKPWCLLSFSPLKSTMY